VDWLDFRRGTLELAGPEGLTVGPAGLLGASLSLGEGKALHVTAATTVEGGAMLALTGGTFRTGGATSAGTLIAADTSVDFGEAGLVSTGELVLVNATVAGPVTSPAGSAIDVVGTVTFQDLVSGEADIYGSGTAVFEGGHSPGDSIATVGIEGGAVYGDEGSLRIELSGATSDAVEIGGDLALGGTLTLEWLSAAGDPDCRFGGAYDILTYGGELSGTFAGIGGNIGEAYVAGIDYEADVPGEPDANAVRIELRELMDGDCDLDGLVGREDFLALRSTFGAAGDWGEGDVTFDGVVDAFDYVALKRNCGRSVPGAAPTIPEPATLLLILAAAGPVLRKRRRRP